MAVENSIMTISVLLPTLFPRLATRAIASLRKTSVPLEVVCCGPLPIPEADIFIQQEPAGVCAAQRACLIRATGDMVMLFSDDVVMAAGWAEKAMDEYHRLIRLCSRDNFVLALCAHPVAVCTCFGRLYANFPLFHRSVAISAVADFGPAYLYSEWSDVALSMTIWERNGFVKRMSERLVLSPKDVTTEADYLPESERRLLDRLGCPEPKRDTFQSDCRAFLDRFKKSVGVGWPCAAEWWRAFNCEVWPGLVENDTVCITSFFEFMQRIRIPPDKGGGQEFNGDMRWRCRTHPNRVAKDRFDLPGECFLMSELTA